MHTNIHLHYSGCNVVSYSEFTVENNLLIFLTPKLTRFDYEHRHLNFLFSVLMTSCSSYGLNPLRWLLILSGKTKKKKKEIADQNIIIILPQSRIYWPYYQA